MAYVLILTEMVGKNLHEFYFCFVVPDSDINPIRYLNQFISKGMTLGKMDREMIDRIKADRKQCMY